MKLRANGVLVQPAPLPAAAWPDLDDVPFVAAALSTPTKLIMTLNPRDFTPASALGVRVLSPAKARRTLLRIRPTFMSAHIARSFSLSLFLHAVLAAALAFWLASSTSEITRSAPALFTLVPSMGPAAAALPAAPTVSLTLPVVRPAAPIDLAPPRESNPPATPAPAKPTPAARRTPSPAKPVATLIIDEFRQRHGPPSPTTTPRSAGAQPAVPRVSESFVPTAASVANSSATGADELAFTANLLRDLRAAFATAGPSTGGLSAVVEFAFSPAGVLHPVRIVRSSGDPTFDAAVLAAFARVRARGFPPAAAGQSYRVTFKLSGD